jgi:hypothetical protein
VAEAEAQQASGLQRLAGAMARQGTANAETQVHLMQTPQFDTERLVTALTRMYQGQQSWLQQGLPVQIGAQE